MYVCQHFQTFQKQLGRLKPDYIWNVLGMGERKFVQTVLVTWPRWLPCPCMVKTLKNLLLRNQRTLKLYMQHGVREYYQICSNDDPGLTLTYFTARSNSVPYAFVWEKGKTMDFSETIVVYDLKLATDDPSDKKFLLISKLCPLGAVCPLPQGYIHVLSHEKNCIKSDFKEISLKLATNGQNDKASLLTSKFCPLGTVCPCQGAIYMYSII